MPHVRKRRAPAQDQEEESDVVPESQRAPNAQRRRVSGLEEEGYGDDAEGAEGATHGDGNLDQMVKNLVRLALASEYSRASIRRSDISTKVLGAQTRQFKTVFAQAQQHLNTVFGMEMVELPMREKVTIQQKRAAAKSQSQGQKTTSSAWILTSTLPPRFRSSDVLPPPQVPTAETEAQYAALYTFIVSCIMLSGGTLSDSRLDRYLSRANVNEVTPFAQSSMSVAIDKTEKLLKRMERDGYIVKVRDNSGGDETVEWIVGPRGKVEVGDQGVRGMVKEVYGEVEDQKELDRRLERSLGVLELRQQENNLTGTNGRDSRRKRGGRETEDGDVGEQQDATDEE